LIAIDSHERIYHIEFENFSKVNQLKLKEDDAKVIDIKISGSSTYFLTD